MCICAGLNGTEDRPVFFLHELTWPPRAEGMSSEAASARARKAGNPNKDPDVLAEKKAAKAERDALRKRADQIKAASWKYGLLAGGLIIGCMCLYSLVTISRATIATVLLDDAAQLKEARPRSAFRPRAPPPRSRATTRHRPEPALPLDDATSRWRYL